jgi:hypothetical protein
MTDTPETDAMNDARNGLITDSWFHYSVNHMKMLKFLRELERERNADRARLDWLCQTEYWFDTDGAEEWTPESFRAAIDKGMAEEPHIMTNQLTNQND